MVGKTVTRAHPEGDTVGERGLGQARPVVRRFLHGTMTGRSDMPKPAIPRLALGNLDTSLRNDQPARLQAKGGGHTTRRVMMIGTHAHHGALPVFSGYFTSRIEGHAQNTGYRNVSLIQDRIETQGGPVVAQREKSAVLRNALTRNNEVVTDEAARYLVLAPAQLNC